MTPRDYSSPTREEAKRHTRDSILDALVRVVVDEGVHAFTVANVAKRAGCSQRTVYRHFASREELLEGLTDSIDSAHPSEDHGAEKLFSHTVEEVVQLFTELDQRRDYAAAETIVSAALGHVPRAKRARWVGLQAELQRRFPALDADEHLAAAAALRVLGSTNSWFHLCVQLGAPPGPAARGVGHAMQLILDDLRRQNNLKGNNHG